MYPASIALLIGGSALCGAAWSMHERIAFRVVQGVGAAGLVAGAFALLGVRVPPRERGEFQGMTAPGIARGAVRLVARQHRHALTTGTPGTLLRQ
jgi:MFS family permease